MQNVNGKAMHRHLSPVYKCVFDINFENIFCKIEQNLNRNKEPELISFGFKYACTTKCLVIDNCAKTLRKLIMSLWAYNVTMKIYFSDCTLQQTTFEYIVAKGFQPFSVIILSYTEFFTFLPRYVQSRLLQMCCMWESVKTSKEQINLLICLVWSGSSL